MSETSLARRAGGHAAKQALRAAHHAEVVRPGLPGGAYRPLSERDLRRIHETALDVLEQVGMADPIPVLRESALAKGCRIDEHGRLCFPRALVEDTIAAAPKSYVLRGRDPKHDQDYAAGQVSFVTGGQAVTTLEADGSRFRPTTIVDAYDFARLTDCLEHVHSHSCAVIPTEITDLRAADINMAYANFAGTAKHFMTSLHIGAHVDDLIALMDLVLGGEGRHKERPFCSAGGCPVVSPLAFGQDNSEVSVAATRIGSPVYFVVAPQAGATAPAALAGTLVQVTAETLAAMMQVQLTAPGHPMIFGPWPFVSDLRTGAFSGGGGEQAVLAAAAAQIGAFYGLPTCVGAGMSDAKSPDAQAGYEKGVTVTAAALAGSGVWEASGMTASLMACSYEAAVIDNDMLGCIQRILRGIEVTEETLSFEAIRDVVHGPGHYLGHPQTLELMESDYLYPEIADRSAQSVWEEAGAPDILAAARERVRGILSSHYPGYIDRATDRRIRERFEILLPEAAMRRGNGRW
jgi:trimethylamine--corrinoid protein Co-methyltransferase